MEKYRTLLFVSIIFLVVVGCFFVMANFGSKPEKSKIINQMANPASVHCIDQGGKLTIRKDETGGETGWCEMPNGSVCEEWQFFRTKECQ